MRSRITCSVVGETMVGKTTLLKSYVTCKPPEIYSPTIFENIKGMFDFIVHVPLSLLKNYRLFIFLLIVFLFHFISLIPGFVLLGKKRYKVNLVDTAGQVNY